MGCSVGANEGVEELELRVEEEVSSVSSDLDESSSSERDGLVVGSFDDAEVQVRAPRDYSLVNTVVLDKVSGIDPDHPLLDLLTYCSDDRHGEHWVVRGMTN